MPRPFACLHRPPGTPPGPAGRPPGCAANAPARPRARRGTPRRPGATPCSRPVSRSQPGAGAPGRARAPSSRPSASRSPPGRRGRRGGPSRRSCTSPRPRPAGSGTVRARWPGRCRVLIADAGRVPGADQGAPGGPPPAPPPRPARARAACSSVSPSRSRVPAGISSTGHRPRPRYWRTNETVPSSWTGTTATAPGWRTTTRSKGLPSGSSRWMRSTRNSQARRS